MKLLLTVLFLMALLDLVWDVYVARSLKSSARQRRGKIYYDYNLVSGFSILNPRQIRKTVVGYVCMFSISFTLSLIN
jgi:hypothetical protein